MNAWKVEKAQRIDVDHLVRKHYLGRWPGVVVFTVGLLREDESAYVGVIVFALPPRETAKRYGVKVAWELARLFIEDGTPKNSETWFMARAINLVRSLHPEVEMPISYADPSVGHVGVIYKAGNWVGDGRTDQDRRTPRFDYRSGDKQFSRRAHVLEGPAFAPIQRIARVSKYRFVYWMSGHERKRQAAKASDIRPESIKHGAGN